MSKSFTPERLEKEDKAKKRIVHVLREHGAKVLDSEMPKVFSLKSVDAETKKSLKEFLGTKFDLFITRNGEHYLAECKYKATEQYKRWVNVNSYDAYYEIASIQFPIVYFIWVEETDKIYRHSITNPVNFERNNDRYGKQIYLIPEDLITEITPSYFNLINSWMSKDSFIRALRNRFNRK